MKLLGCVIKCGHRFNFWAQKRPLFYLTFFKFYVIIKKKVIGEIYMSEQRTIYDDMIDEYFNRHPDAGLAWWQLPLEQQPEGFKQEMYDIIWDLTHKEEKND